MTPMWFTLEPDVWRVQLFVRDGATNWSLHVQAWSPETHVSVLRMAVCSYGDGPVFQAHTKRRLPAGLQPLGARSSPTDREPREPVHVRRESGSRLFRPAQLFANASKRPVPVRASDLPAPARRANRPA